MTDTPTATLFDGVTYDADQDEGRLSNQLAGVLHYLRDGQWWTLAALSRATGFPQSSVSARIRDLRKPRFGSRVVDRRRVRESNGLHEYRLDPEARTDPPRPDPTLGHAVLVQAVLDDTEGEGVIWLALCCQHCEWRHRMLPGCSVEQLTDALARHP